MKSFWRGEFLPGVDYSDHVARGLAKAMCRSINPKRPANDPPVEHLPW